MLYIHNIYIIQYRKSSVHFTHLKYMDYLNIFEKFTKRSNVSFQDSFFIF